MRLSQRKVTVDAMVRIPKRSADMDYIVSHFSTKIIDDYLGKAYSHPLYVDEGSHICLPRREGMEYLRSLGILEYVDKMSVGYEPADVVKKIELKDYQVPFAESICNMALTHNDIMAVAKTGRGKCLGVDTPILMYDGTIKAVQHVKVGDTLMGPDSRPRVVLSTTTGTDRLYKITPTKGDSFVCNSAHILSLKLTGTDNVVNISVEDYLATNQRYKHLHKLWRSGVEFLEQPVPFDPYIVGVYLGGHETEVNSLFTEYSQLSLVNAYGEKVIPIEYLSNSREVRLQILAGLIDTDGSYTTYVYDLVFKNKPLAYGVVYLARSLGLAAYVKKCTRGIKSTGFVGEYYRVCISGELATIPCKVARKRASVRRQKKNVLLTGFSVEYQGVGEYYGFTLDGDRLFMLGDFTVTHNTVIGLEVARRMATTVLVIVDQDNIKTQWIERVEQHWGLPSSRVGIIQGKIKDYSDKTIVIGMLQTLYDSQFEDELYQYFGMIIIDESHVVAARKFANVCNKFSAYLRLGLTATPREDQYRKIVEYHIGKPDIILDSKHEESKVLYLTYDKPVSYIANVSDKNGPLISELAADTERNWALVDVIVQLYNENREILVTSDRIVQLENLYSMLVLSGIPKDDVVVITGKKSTIKYAKDDRPRRKPEGLQKGAEYTPIKVQWITRRASGKSKENYKREGIPIRLATYSLFGKAMDIPTLDSLVEASPRSKIEQVHGRILRHLDGKQIPICVTIRDINSYKCEYQFMRRLIGYKNDNASIADYYDREQEEDYAELHRKVESKVRWLQAQKIYQSEDGIPIIQTNSTETTPDQGIGTSIGRARTDRFPRYR